MRNWFTDPFHMGCGKKFRCSSPSFFANTFLLSDTSNWTIRSPN